MHRFVTRGTLPIGSTIAGLLGTAFGLRIAMIVAALTAFTCMIPLLYSPLRHARQFQRAQ